MERTHHNRNENSCWLQRTTVSPSFIDNKLSISLRGMHRWGTSKKKKKKNWLKRDYMRKGREERVGVVGWRCLSMCYHINQKKRRTTQSIACMRISRRPWYVFNAVVVFYILLCVGLKTRSTETLRRRRWPGWGAGIFFFFFFKIEGKTQRKKRRYRIWFKKESPFERFFFFCVCLCCFCSPHHLFIWMKRVRASSKNKKKRSTKIKRCGYFFLLLLLSGRLLCFGVVAVPVYVRCPSIFQKFSHSSFSGSE